MIKPWTLLAAILLVGGAIFAVVIYKKHFADGGEGGSKEEFESEKVGDPSDDKIVEVADAYRRIKGKSPSTADVRRVMKAMRKSGGTASDVVKREVEMDKAGDGDEDDDGNERKGGRDAETDDDDDDDEDNDEEEPEDMPVKKYKNRSPAMDAMDTSMMRRIEDELEGMVNRIDGLLEEIQAMKGRQVSGPLTEDSVESFVPYHPV